MCGIVGLLFHRASIVTLVNALRRLEYRGYDSAGIATINNQGKISLCKSVGVIDKLAAKLKDSPIDGSIAIGHTRWATHGKPSINNAHPQQIGQVAVVHNGIIENYRELAETIDKKILVSETDTEIATALISHDINNGVQPLQAVSNLRSKIKGGCAIVAMIENYPDQLICWANESPLCVARSDFGMMVASDPLAFGGKVKEVTFLNDGDIFIIDRDGYKGYDINNNNISRKKITNKVDNWVLDKGSYRHFFAYEASEQPEKLQQTLSRSLDYLNNTSTIGLNGKVDKIIAELDQILLTGCGAAYFAGLVGKIWIEKIAKVPVEVDLGSELRYRDLPKSVNTWLGVISQSGETADTLGALRVLKKNGMKSFGIINRINSVMAREVDVLMPTYAGIEVSVASTKAFTAQLAVLATLAIMIAKVRGTITSAYEKKLVKNLRSCPAYVQEVLNLNLHIEKVAHTLSNSASVFYIGRGDLFPIALEGALKLKELSYIPTEGLAAGNLKHGPISLVDENMPVVALVQSGPLLSKMVSNIIEVKSRGAKVIIIADEECRKQMYGLYDHLIEVPKTPEICTPIIFTIAVQLLAYHTACHMGTDVDHPRNLAKSVTVE